MHKIYPIAFVCYCSSHDDFIGIWSTREKVQIEVDRLNTQYLEDSGEESFPYSSPPYYFWEEVCELPACPRGRYKVIYLVPSVGKFHIFPLAWVAEEEYTIDTPTEII